MIYIKSPEEIEAMRKSCAIIRDLLELIQERIKPGVTTYELDKWAHEFITAHGAKPNFLHYGGFRGSICTSIDDVVVHGTPSKKIHLEEGQIIGIDGGAVLNGWHSDAARTFEVGKVSPEKHRLVEVTRESFFEGIKQAKQGNRLFDISAAIQSYVEARGFSIVRDMTGHGIGRDLHEDPSIPNHGIAGRGVRLQAGMTLAIEPMVNMGDWRMTINGWDARTLDGLPSAHYENTVVITEDGVEILTL